MHGTWVRSYHFFSPFKGLHTLRQSGCITGLFRDDPNTLTKHKQLWHEFNICWLSLCQKQKDLSEALLRNGGHRRRQSLQSPLPATMLSADSIEKMGQELIRLCDLVEPHGLVDYQMGIWEEEILDSKAQATLTFLFSLRWRLIRCILILQFLGNALI